MGEYLDESIDWKSVYLDVENGLVAFPQGARHHNPILGTLGVFITILVFIFIRFYSEFWIISIGLPLTLILSIASMYAIMRLDMNYSLDEWIPLATIAYILMLIYEVPITIGYMLFGIFFLIGTNFGITYLLNNSLFKEYIIKKFLVFQEKVYKLDTKEVYEITDQFATFPIMKTKPFKIDYTLESEESEVKRIFLLLMEYKRKSLFGRYKNLSGYFVHVELTKPLEEGEKLIIVAQ